MTHLTPKRILVADHVAGLAQRIAAARPDLELRARPPAAITAADLDWADTFIGFRKPGPDGWGRVRWIHSIGAGIDGLVFRQPVPAGILVTRSGEDFGPAIGEWCVTRALAVNQHLARLADDQRERRWNRELEPVMLRGQRALIVGTGRVGRGIARAFGALGCQAAGLSRRGEQTSDFSLVAPVGEFAAAVLGVQWLVLAAPLTAETAGFLSRARLEQCGGCYLMNVGRGALVDEAALPEALDRGWIGGAALDVFEREPLPADSPLWNHPKVTISPHLSGPSTLDATVRGFLDSLAEIDSGARPTLAVDPALGY